MTDKKMLSADETRVLIEHIERRAGCGMPYRADYDAFKDYFTVAELLTTMLSELGYSEEWIYHVFDPMLADAVLRHNTRLVKAGCSPYGR